MQSVDQQTQSIQAGQQSHPAWLAGSAARSMFEQSKEHGQIMELCKSLSESQEQRKQVKTEHSQHTQLPKLKVRQPLCLLPAWSVFATIFAYYGWLDEAVDLLQNLSKDSRQYLSSEHRYSLLGFMKKSKLHPNSQGMPATLSKLVRRQIKKSHVARKICCRARYEELRRVILATWHDANLTSLWQFCMSINNYCFNLFCKSELVTLLLRRRDFEPNSEIKKLADWYLEFVIHEEFVLVITVKILRVVDQGHVQDMTWESYVESERLRYLMFEYKELAIANID